MSFTLLKLTADALEIPQGQLLQFGFPDRACSRRLRAVARARGVGGSKDLRLRTCLLHIQSRKQIKRLTPFLRSFSPTRSGLHSLRNSGISRDQLRHSRGVIQGLSYLFFIFSQDCSEKYILRGHPLHSLESSEMQHKFLKAVVLPLRAVHSDVFRYYFNIVQNPRNYSTTHCWVAAGHLGSAALGDGWCPRGCRALWQPPRECQG